MDLASLLIFAGALLVAAGTPGPSIAALVARVIGSGVGSVLPFLLAMWIGEAAWLACAVFGLAVLAQTFQLAFAALKWAGIAYLLFLAWTMWRAPVAPAEDLPEAGSGWRLFWAGLAVTLGNPKIMVFYLALLPSIINVQAITLLDWAELVLTLLAVIIAIDLTWSLLAVKARTLLRTPRAVRVTNRASATLMTGAAAAIATR